MQRGEKKIRIALNIIVIIAFFVCFMEWGKGNSAFVFEVLIELFRKPDWIQNLTHPVILAGILGVLLLVLTPILPKKYFWVQFVGIVLPGLVVAIIFFTGILSGSWKTIISCLPFFAMVIISFRYGKNRSSNSL